jgi:two-component system, cell cycle sensor histidine kinase and response regulator CckA
MSAESLKILLIEDNPGDARLIKEALSEVGSTEIELIHATRLQEGLLKLAAEKFDVLLLDLSLPDASGLDTIRQANLAVAGVPIIVLTGFNDEAFSVAVVHEGAQDFLVKGQFDGALLMRAIRYAIERKESQQELKASREFAFNIIDSSLDMIIAVDREEKIAEFNKAAQKAFGYRSEEILGKPFNLLFADSAEATRVREKTLAEGKCVQQITNIRKNGERFPASLSASVLRDERGDFQGIVGTSRDITEQISLEAQLRHAQKMDSIGQLAAGVAHDFNNILTVIQGYASLLTLKNNLPPEISEPLNEINLASEHAAGLTRQLLTFSRKQTIQPRSLDLNHILCNITKMLTRLLGAEIALKLDLAASLPSIHADAGMLEQVIINLAVNARDAMPKGGEIHIHTASVKIDGAYVKQRPEARAGNFVCLSIADTGTGMDVATLTRVFEPFFTTKEPGKGTGLGLATVYGIVQSHQGWVEVSSILGRGTTFKIFLAAAEISTDDQVEPLLREKEYRGDETILVVEDIAELRGMVRQILESYGYNVIDASNGVEALSLWKEHKENIDLLLTDVVMPEGMSGHDLAQKLLAGKKSLDVIYTSGHSIDLIGRGTELREGFNFLQKPYQALALAQTIRNCLDRSAASVEKN